MLLLNDSLKSAVQDNLAAIASRKAGFDPAQPRDPQGAPNSTGGQWAGPGGGSGSSSSGGAGSRSRPSRQLLPSPRTQLLPLRRPAGLGGGDSGSPSKPSVWQELFGVKPAHAMRKPGWEDDFDMLEGGAGRGGGAYGGPMGGGAVSRVSKPVEALSKTEAAAATEAITARSAGRPLATHESNPRIRRAADAVEEFLGGRPDPKNVIRNDAGDLIITRGNKKFRTDINNPNRKPNGEPDDPHFHLQELKDGKWIDAGEMHRNYFKKEGFKK